MFRLRFGLDDIGGGFFQFTGARGQGGIEFRLGTLPVGCFLFLMQVVAQLIRNIGMAVTGREVFPVRTHIPGFSSGSAPVG
jgi:hypothetical protein